MMSSGIGNEVLRSKISALCSLKELVSRLKFTKLRKGHEDDQNGLDV